MIDYAYVPIGPQAPNALMSSPCLQQSNPSAIPPNGFKGGRFGRGVVAPGLRDAGLGFRPPRDNRGNGNWSGQLSTTNLAPNVFDSNLIGFMWILLQ